MMMSIKTVWIIGALLLAIGSFVVIPFLILRKSDESENSGDFTRILQNKTLTYCCLSNYLLKFEQFQLMRQLRDKS